MSFAVPGERSFIMKFLKSFCAPFTVALFVVSTHASGASFDTPGDAFDTYGKVGKANVLSLTGSGDPSVGGRIHLEVDGGPANAFGAGHLRRMPERGKAQERGARAGVLEVPLQGARAGR